MERSNRYRYLESADDLWVSDMWTVLLSDDPFERHAAYYRLDDTGLTILEDLVFADGDPEVV